MAAILSGAVLLHSPWSCQGGRVSFLDALFTATSAVCVTGLTVVDTGSTYSRTGQTIILLLIQTGGLGIMSFSSLALYLWKKKISLTDKIAVGQSLLNNASFHLGRFLVQIAAVTLLIELFGALLLFFSDPQGFPPFSALFHAVSAFCNAGFSLNSDNLMRWQGSWAVNLRRVREIRPMEDGGWEVKLDPPVNRVLPVSRRRVAEPERWPQSRFRTWSSSPRRDAINR